jgi:replication factor A1
MLIGDWTSNRWVTCFTEVAEKIFGYKTDEIADMMENEKQQFDSMIQGILFKPQSFKLRTKVETYGDIPRSKISALGVRESSSKEYNRYLLNNIQRLTGINLNEKSK